jgi:GNAT superfamily N-acetyltransferase
MRHERCAWLTQAEAGEEREKQAAKAALGAYWYLDYLAVDTSLQSRGLGTRALLQTVRQAQVGGPRFFNPWTPV